MRQTILDLIADHVTLREIAERVRITRQTILAYARSHPEFRAEMDDARSTGRAPQVPPPTPPKFNPVPPEALAAIALGPRASEQRDVFSAEPSDLPPEFDVDDPVLAHCWVIVKDPKEHPLLRKTALDWLGKCGPGVVAFRQMRAAEYKHKLEYLRAAVELNREQPPPAAASGPMLIVGLPPNGSEAPRRGPQITVIDGEATDGERGVA